MHYFLSHISPTYPLGYKKPKHYIKVITLLEKQVKSYNKKGWDEIYHAYLYASKLHKKQKRDSGEAYITHPLSVCLILSKMHEQLF